MHVDNLIASLERFGRSLPELVRGVSPNDARWKPPDGAWSILEIVRHLGDEEEFDFGLRVRSTLNDPAAGWPPIDPEDWAVERRYNEGDLDEAAGKFVTLRSESVAWLRSLKNPDWSLAYQHPKIGPLRAGDLLAAWVAHDALHLRQIAKRQFQLASRDAGDFHTQYAGEWH